MLKLGIESAGYTNDGIADFKESAIKMKQHGYNCTDYRLENPDSFWNVAPEEEVLIVAEKIGNEAKEAGIEIYQAHGLWPTDDTTEEKRLKNIQTYIREIKICSQMGCKRLVVHPCMPAGCGRASEETFELNVCMVRALLPYLKEYDVILCMENMPFVNDAGTNTAAVKKIVSTINDSYCKICLDTGHSQEWQEDIYESVKLIGKDLEALHVHDNVFGDRHDIPYRGRINWDGFLKGLKEIGYKGCFSLETAIPKGMPEPIREEFRVALANLGKYMANQV